MRRAGILRRALRPLVDSMTKPEGDIANLRITFRVECVDCGWKGYITVPATDSIWRRPCPQCRLDRVYANAITAAGYIGQGK
jgi:hypothetical protein